MKTSSALPGFFIICLLVLSAAFGGCTTQKTATPSAAPAGTTAIPAAPAAAGPVVCPTGFSDCNGACRDTTSDIINCGGCGNICPGDSTCKDSQCVCKDGYASCNGKCQDVTSDTSNCGKCKYQCSVGEKCLKGVCTPPGGTSGSTGKESGIATCTDLSLTACGNWCIDVQTNSTNCGMCGNDCGSGQTCVSGKCEAGSSGSGSGGTTPKMACFKPKLTCDGKCTDVQTDFYNCGSCGKSCSPGQTCNNGACESLVLCLAGNTACNGGCVDLQTDVNNCGSCGHQCLLANQKCEDGQCKSTGTGLHKATP